MKVGLINALTGAGIQARTTVQLEEECLYRLFDSGGIAADTIRVSSQRSQRKMIFFTKPRQLFTHKLWFRLETEAFLNIGCIKNLRYLQDGASSAKGACVGLLAKHKSKIYFGKIFHSVGDFYHLLEGPGGMFCFIILWFR